MTEKTGTNSHASLWRSFSAIQPNLEMGDGIIFLYLLAFARQYFWFINNNSIAWTLTALLAAFVWFLHLLAKDQNREKMPVQFWLVVAAPLFVVYAMRAAFPDTSFDVLDYRLINSERALHGFPFPPGDFFPARFPFNPAPDMVTGIARHILGYRLGTSVNYLVLLWVGAILYRLLRPYVESVWLRCLGVLLLLLTEHVLFVVNNYMVDLFALPLMLEATLIALAAGRGNDKSYRPIRLALLLGASVAFKLTNLAFAIPILIVYAYKGLIAGANQQRLRHCLLLTCAFVVPLLPFTLYIYWQTRNPVFPLYNKIFRSPFWPTNDFVGVRWGPVTDDPRWQHMKWWEVMLWPVLLPFKVEHTAGGLGPHPGRISLGFVAALIGLVLRKVENRVKALCFVTIVGALLWSAISGMLRYAIYLELIGGFIVLYLSSRLYLWARETSIGLDWRRYAHVLLWSIMAAQSVIALSYVYRFEWSTRPSFFENPKAYINDARYFLRDYSLPPFLPAPDRALVSQVQTWAESSALESGIQVQLKNDAPALCLYMPEFFSTARSRERFAQALRQVGHGKMFALCRTEYFKGSVENITAAGLAIGRVTPLSIPYYSQYTRLNMVLIEVLAPGDRQSTRQIRITEASAALPNDALRAEMSWSQPLPKILRAGQKETIYVSLKNVSNFDWPALGRNDGMYRLSLGNHWLDRNDTIVVNDDGRNVLLYDLNPGDEIELPLTITAPPTPGSYLLEIDMVQERVTWFGLRGSKTLSSPITVEK